MPNTLAALRAAREAEGRARMTHEAWAPPEDLTRARKWVTGPIATDDYGNEIPRDSSSLLSLLNSLTPHPGQSEEQIAENTAGFMLPAGGLGAVKDLARGPVGESVLRIFAGPGAKTADLNALAQARHMAEGGADNETIRAATDWFQGPDQKWRFEIDDSGSKAGEPESVWGAAELERGNNVQTNARAALLHPKLAEAYPDTGRIGVTLDPKGDGTGTYWAGAHWKEPNPLEHIRTSIDPDYSANRSLMLHELQHAIQQREGFARGGSPTTVASAHKDLVKKEYDAIRAADPSLSTIQAFDSASHTVYKRLAGEVEARDVQARMDFTPEQRRATPPYSSQGIAPEDMTINFLGGENKATVWHGTPHKFAPTEGNPLGEFDLSKIGTGEGAQAYGHGVYLAEHPEVAKEYAKNVSYLPALEKHGVMAFSPPSHLYKVDIPDDKIASMLDWDKPLSEQPEHVQSALMKAGVSKEDITGNGGFSIRTTPSGKGFVIENSNGSYGRYNSLEKAQARMRELQGAYSTTGELAYRGLANRGAGAEKTSEALRAAGIPGLRYLDQGSRGAGQGTSNYVVFDPAITRILGRE